MRTNEAREVMRSGLSRWCTGCGKWEFQCQCHSPVFYCYPADVLLTERRPDPTMYVRDGQRVSLR